MSSAFENAVKKYLPTVCTVLASVGVLATSVLAVKETPKAMTLIEKEEEKKGEKLTPLETVKATWKCYILPATVGAGTILCIIGGRTIDAKTIAALTGAVTLSNGRYKKYVDKVKEMLGIETHEKILDEIAASKTEQVHIYASGVFTESDISFEGLDEDPILCYDSLSDRYFESTPTKVLMAEYYANRNFVLGKPVCVNDFYDFLGLDHTDLGDTMGWSSYHDELGWIDFTNKRTVLDNDFVCYRIDTAFVPDTVLYAEPKYAKITNTIMEKH